MPAYPPDRPNDPDTSDLVDRIPGWGVDADPATRPAVPKELPVGPAPGVHWDVPEDQPDGGSRERSNEHAFLTPVFGTSTPPSGLSGVIRRSAYRFSEGRAAHWLILIGADRVAAVEAHLRSFATGRPDNPITETGIGAELSHRGLSSRAGRKRVDDNHAWLDPILVGGPWVAAMAATGVVTRAVLRRGRSRGR
ncbi:hypothetical protein [Gordonia amicalis]|uniref:Uncharacterized protein n=1 Tax=Gordonia amicalis TaxID=89053 RepID=A0ABU4DCC5_9ACTN|nr:hypothetical protein [Gordonia amicalis]MDV6307370.1 hypothetical protein [Gordonia amicalis]MDV7101266.1 hypothetical protein [Gordonia amicalis]MDV7175713.1 hypothetical protein [Gordonia amicalis]NKX77549.1 hypothetical protein [Gordonia amicalis]UOG21905.1 hypothetical protein MTX80_01885 [Gordonia amicalis]